ncbi:protein of unknown function [Micropruina glycogenica]|uniref:Phosphotyrosine protein phosphatase I domain-containing protein n=1 Tax=Micropruina glycogenica TaxID=75385 RepID=A0A2N9JBI6_9ACTN|nr:protein of unknown function [Micropruina glycogenica]
MTLHPVSERTWESLHSNEKLALRQAAARLSGEFTGLYGQQTIERFLASSFDQFADRATITKFLPLLAERFARQRLHALARVEGLHADGKPVVLFLCTHNAGRSQMALGFFQALTGNKAVAWSGGSEPGLEINPTTVAAMAERGIDIATSSPNPGPTKPSVPPTSSSPWAAATPAPSSPGSATRAGNSTTPTVKTSTPSAVSGTNSNAASEPSSAHSSSDAPTVEATRGGAPGPSPPAPRRSHPVSTTPGLLLTTPSPLLGLVSPRHGPLLDSSPRPSLSEYTMCIAVGQSPSARFQAPATAPLPLTVYWGPDATADLSTPEVSRRSTRTSSAKAPATSKKPS